MQLAAMFALAAESKGITDYFVGVWLQKTLLRKAALQNTSQNFTRKAAKPSLLTYFFQPLTASIRRKKNTESVAAS